MTENPRLFPTPALANAAEHVLGAWTPRSFMIEGLTAVRAGDRATGPAYTIRLRKAATRSRQNAARALAAFDAAPAGGIVVVQATDDLGGAVVGDIIAHRLRRLGVAGVVVEGPVRDIDGLDGFGPPIWYRDAVATGLEMAETEAEAEVELDIGGVKVSPGVTVTVDRDGAFFLPRGQADAILARAAAVVAREETLHAALADGRSLVDALGFADAAAP